MLRSVNWVSSIQAVRGGETEKGRSDAAYFHRMGYRVLAAVGIDNTEDYRISAICRVHMARADKAHCRWQRCHRRNSSARCWCVEDNCLKK